VPEIKKEEVKDMLINGLLEDRNTFLSSSFIRSPLAGTLLSKLTGIKRMISFHNKILFSSFTGVHLECFYVTGTPWLEA